MIRVVTAFTPDYAELAARLESSCQQFNVPYSGVAFESRGSWAANNAFKPTAILRVMQETGDDCLWLDADMYLRYWPTDWPAGDVLLKYSDPPEAQVFDFNLRKNVPNTQTKLTPWCGHMLWRNTYLSRVVIAKWQELCGECGEITNDEQCLIGVLDMVYADTPLIIGYGHFRIGPLNPAFIHHTPAGMHHGKPTAAEGWL